MHQHLSEFYVSCFRTAVTLVSSRLCSIHPVYDAKVVAMLTDTLATLEDNTHYSIISTLISPLASTTANAKSLERILHKLSESQPWFSGANRLSHQLSQFIMRSLSALHFQQSVCVVQATTDKWVFNVDVLLSKMCFFFVRGRVQTTLFTVPASYCNFTLIKRRQF